MRNRWLLLGVLWLGLAGFPDSRTTSADEGDAEEAGAGEAGAGEAAAPRPFAGLGPLSVGSHWDRNPTHLERLSGLGPTLLHVAPLAWGDIEAAPPRGRTPRYDWKELDESVLHWQLAGLDPVLILSPSSPWAAAPRGNAAWLKEIDQLLPKPDAAGARRAATGVPPLRKDTWPLWERFVRDVVERYDGDGRDDMAGLRGPVRHVQVLDRADSPTTWIGSEDDYMRLLHHAGLGAKAASTDCRVLATSIDLGATGYAPHPDEAEWRYRIDQLAPKDAALARRLVERRFSLVRRLIESPDFYDVLPQRGSDNLADDVANVAFLRRTLDENKGQDVAVWLVDNPTRKLGAAHAPGDVAPKADEQRLRRRWLPVARNPAHSEHEAARAWLRRGQAFDLLRGLGRARAAGAEAVLFLAPADELPADWPRRTERSGQGFLAAGRDAAAARPTRTPSWYALRQALRLLDGTVRARETPIGAPGRSVIYEFDRKQGPAWIAVLMLDARLSWAGVPGSDLPTRDVLIQVPAGEYVLEACQLGPGEPERRTVSAKDGSFVLSMTPAPVYLIPKVASKR